MVEHSTNDRMQRRIHSGFLAYQVLTVVIGLLYFTRNKE